MNCCCNSSWSDTIAGRVCQRVCCWAMPLSHDLLILPLPWWHLTWSPCLWTKHCLLAGWKSLSLILRRLTSPSKMMSWTQCKVPPGSRPVPNAITIWSVRPLHCETLSLVQQEKPQRKSVQICWHNLQLLPVCWRHHNPPQYVSTKPYSWRLIWEQHFLSYLKKRTSLSYLNWSSETYTNKCIRVVGQLNQPLNISIFKCL